MVEECDDDQACVVWLLFVSLFIKFVCLFMKFVCSFFFFGFSSWCFVRPTFHQLMLSLLVCSDSFFVLCGRCFGSLFLYEVCLFVYEVRLFVIEFFSSQVSFVPPALCCLFWFAPTTCLCCLAAVLVLCFFMKFVYLFIKFMCLFMKFVFFLKLVLFVPLSTSLMLSLMVCFYV